MSAWQHLSGYLYFKQAGALSRFKQSKRLWFLLNDESCLLYYYSTQQDAHKSVQHLGSINIEGAAISLSLSESNQFIIISSSEEYILTAENHESMMIWLLGLQRKRDAFANKDISTKREGEPSSPTARSESLSALLTTRRDQSSSDVFRRLSLQTWRDYRRQQDMEGRGGGAACLECGSDTTVPKFQRIRQTSSSDETGSLPGDEVFGSSEDPAGIGSVASVGRHHHKALRRMVSDNMLTVSSRTNLSLSSSNLHSEMLIPGAGGAGDFVLHGSTGNLSSSPGSHRSASPSTLTLSGITGGSATPHGSGSDCAGGNITPTNAAPSHSCSSLGVAYATTYASADDRKESVSRSSASSDSALDRCYDVEVSARVCELEQELITAKCELAQLKNSEATYKDLLCRKDQRIGELDRKLAEVNEYKTDQKSVDKRMKEKVRVLQNQNCFLNEEVKKLAKLQQREREGIYTQQSKMAEIKREVDQWRRDYVYLLQSSITVPTGDIMDGMEVRLYGGSTHRARVQELLEEARKINPSLPTYERLARSSVHVDRYGFRHSHDSEGLLLHYICQQLQLHYSTHTIQYMHHLQQWRHTIQRGKTRLLDAKDVKRLCRQGIPSQYRADVWRHLVYHHVKDVMDEKGSHYFINLCNTAHESEHAGKYRKQISLDLLRTMPNNVRFNHIRSEGTRQLQNVLLAFCHHNTSVGYCQGMNFIAGMSLLFLGPEDAFWTLVAVTEKYFTPSYFDQYLTGAQADQEVLKEIVEQKLPRLAAHLRAVDIDLSTVTLNWFLAVFFDAVPFETLVRIWDVFLLEGPKVLFRFALAMLSVNEEGILEKKDTISIMRHIKASARITYDVEGLIKTAFEELKPFPRRQAINSRQVFYLNALKEQVHKKMAYRQNYDDTDNMLRELEQVASTSPVFECATATDVGEVWVCYGTQNSAKVCLVEVGERLLYTTNIQVDNRIMCVTIVEDKILLIGTLAKRLHAYSLNTREELWCAHLHDTILSMTCYRQSDTENKLFASLANGTISIIENISDSEPVESPYYIPIGRSPVTHCTIIGSHLWCACGNEVHIMNASTLDMTDRFTVSGNPFDTILSLTYHRGFGVWLSVRGSSILELWDHKVLQCKMLYDVKENRHPLFHKEEESCLNQSRITALLPVDRTLWVGLGDGNVIVCDVMRIPCTELTATDSTSSRSASPMPLTHQRATALYGAPTGAGGECGRARGVVDAKSFQNKVQQLYEEITQMKESDLRVRKKSGKDENRNTTGSGNNSKRGSKKNKRGEQKAEKKADGKENGVGVEMKEEQGTKTEENVVACASEQVQNERHKTERGKHQAKRSKSLKRDKTNVSDDIEGSKDSKAGLENGINGTSEHQHAEAETAGKDRPASEAAPADVPVVMFDNKSVDFTGLSTDLNGDSIPSKRHKQKEKKKYSKLNPELINSMAMNGAGVHYHPSPEFTLSDSTYPGQLMTSQQMMLAPDIREYDEAGLEVSSILSPLSPISESRESLSSPADDRVSPVPIGTKRDDPPNKLTLPEPATAGTAGGGSSAAGGGSSRLSPISGKSSSIHSPSSPNYDASAYSYELSLQVKLKVADRPIKAFVSTKLASERVIISFAGNHGDDEAVLQWRKRKDEKLWTNVPILEVCPETHYPVPPTYMRHIPSSRSHSADDLLDGYDIVTSSEGETRFKKSASCDD